LSSRSGQHRAPLVRCGRRLPPVHESPEDFVELQRLLDDSYANAGNHLLEIITTERRLNAQALSEKLQGMCLLVVATVTEDGRPIAGPVDGIFYRGCFYFASSPESVRMRHIRHRPAVSATHLPGEELAVTVHGVAELIDVASLEYAHFRQTVVGVYGPWFEEVLESNPQYARIIARRMFTFWMPVDGGS